MKVFRDDPYKVYRAVCLVVGFSGAVAIYLIFVQKRILEAQDWWLGVTLLCVLVALLIVNSKWQYVALDERRLTISRVLWKEDIPVPNIQSLSYEFTGRALMLFVHYVKEGSQKWKGFVVDYMSTEDISSLNDTVLGLNPKVEVRMDKLSKEAQERNSKKFAKLPTTLSGRIAFAAKWLVVGGIFSLILSAVLAPRT